MTISIFFLLSKNNIGKTWPKHIKLINKKEKEIMLKMHLKENIKNIILIKKNHYVKI